MQSFSSISNIFKGLKSQFTQNKLLLIAIVISLLLHVLLLTKFSLTLPEQDNGHQALEMRLVNLQPIQKTTPIPVEPVAPTPRPASQVNTEEAAFAAPVAEEVHEISAIDEVSVDNQEPMTETPSIATPQAENPPEPQASNEPSTEATDTNAVDIMAKNPTLQAYQYAETEFEVKRGSDSTAAGLTRIIFNIDKNGTYTISSNTQAKGLASLFFSTLIQKSEGTVTANGLVPSFYLYQYGTDKDKTQTARFVWSDNALQMHSAKGDKTETLVAGTQDFLSFMYQFMFSPPTENMQLMMTNGKKLSSYTYSFEGEEVINTKIGELKTVHLLKSGNEEEKTELWLALDYQFLPVKIRKTEKDGSVIEQIVTNIYKKSP